MLRLEGCNGGQPGVEVRPECVRGVLTSSRNAPGKVPGARGEPSSGCSLSPGPKALAFSGVGVTGAKPGTGEALLHRIQMWA
jgi:hypothetical protein